MGFFARILARITGTAEDRGKQDWKLGDRVLAKSEDSFFYPGQIHAVQGVNCQIGFDDGSLSWVHRDNVRVPDLTIGSKVFCRMHAGPNFAPATVAHVNGEKLHVCYDHGDDEWTTLSMVRVQRPIANVLPEPIAAPLKQVGPGGIAPDLGEPVLGSDWRVGDRVLARWLDFFWYPGTILGIGARGIHILYDDGDQRIVLDRALMPLVIDEGEHLFVRLKSEAQRVYTPAVAVRVRGELIDVELEDGTQESNLRVSRARFWRCPAGIGHFAFDEGDRIFAVDCDNFVYPAEIVSVDGDRVVVQYLDGPERMITPELVRKFELRPGVRVECRWKGSPSYFPGRLEKVEQDRILVKYDDEEEEWSTVRLIRLPPVT